MVTPIENDIYHRSIQLMYLLKEAPSGQEVEVQRIRNLISVASDTEGYTVGLREICIRDAEAKTNRLLAPTKGEPSEE